MTGEPIHLLKERKGKDVTAKCGAKPSIRATTVWWTEVTCVLCLGAMAHDAGGGMHRATI